MIPGWWERSAWQRLLAVLFAAAALALAGAYALSQSGARSGAVVDVRPDEPTTLVFPTFLHTWGFQRVGQRGATFYSRGRTRFDDPQGIAVTVLDSGDDPDDSRDDDEVTVYGVNSGRGEVLYNSSMFTLSIYGSRGRGPDQFREPHGISADPAGNVVVADTGNDRVAVLRNDGRLLTHIRYLRILSSSDSLSAPWDVVLTPDEGLWVSDSGNGRLVLFGLDGEVRRIVHLGTTMRSPGALAAAHRDQRWSYYREEAIYVASQAGDLLLKLDADGNEVARVTAYSAGLDRMELRYLITDFYGNVWATDGSAHRVLKFDRNLRFLAAFGMRGNGDREFEDPRGIGLWPRFGQMILAEREGAQYYWVGADMSELVATQTGNALDLTYHLTEAAYITVRSRYTGGGTVELARRRFRTAGPRTERLLLDSDRPLAWIEIVVEPTYSSYSYREKVFQLRFDALERH